MRKVNEYHLYELAVAIHPLTESGDGSNYSSIWLPWFNARTALQKLFQQRQLEFCYDAANKLYAAINAVVPTELDEIVKKFPAKDVQENPLSYYEIHSVVEAAQEFETVLRTELNNADTYFIDPKGTHKTSLLLTTAHRELPEGVVTEMPEIRNDFDQAGRCLLFDNSTAAGFHLMRSIETAIYKYLKALTGKDVPVKSRNWGVYVKALQKAGADDKVIGTLQHVKDAYRNPILHPEVTLTPEEAQALFGLSVSAIIQIVGAMKNSQSATIPFPAADAIPLP